MANLLDKRFIINTGKGGVGKTTISAAMALAFAQRGKRVLLIELNARDKIGQLFGRPEVGADVVSIAPYVSAVNTNPQEALREYGMMVLKVKMVYKTVFENKLVMRFLRAVPGLPELTMLGKAFNHERETDKGGRHVWDVIIVDAPATGHGMFLLQIPQVITGAVSGGLMAKEADKMVELIRDRRKTSINLITLTEEMPVNETLEYQKQLAEKLNVEPGYIIANGVYPRTFGDADKERVDALLNAHSEPDDVSTLLRAASFRHERCEMQGQYLTRLQRESKHPVIEVPFYFDADFDKTVLDRIAMHIGLAIDNAEDT